MTRNTVNQARMLQDEETHAVSMLVQRARAAMAAFENATQERVDEAVMAAAWALYKPSNAERLAKLAVETTGLGDVESKIVKNQRKTFGALRDLLRVRSVGVIEEDPEHGIVKYAKPVGVVAAITPSTNPSATPVNKAMFALKGRNAIIMAPSPSGMETTSATIELVRSELEKIGLPPDLVQVPNVKPSKTFTAELMRQADLVVATGSQSNIRQAYSSGTPALGVGAGNVPVIIDEGADLADAAKKIAASKTFDNATSCSSENAVVIVDSIYDEALQALIAEGGYLADEKEKRTIEDALWRDGKLNRGLIARAPSIFASQVELSNEAHSARFFMVEESGVGRDYPFSGEKLSVVLTVYRAKSFKDAADRVQQLLDYQGNGHSCGIHTQDMDHARYLAEHISVVRVLVNQAHTFGNGGSFDNGLNFTLSMGCGTWAGNSISENLSYKHFLNITHLVTTIQEDKPTEEALFGAYWDRYGK